MTVLSSLRSWLTTNLHLKVIAILLAIFFWFQLQMDRETEVRWRLPFQVTLDDTTRVVVSELPGDVEVLFSGRGWDLFGLWRKGAEVRVEIENPRSYRVDVRLTPANVRIPPGVSGVTAEVIEPAQLTLQLDRLGSQWVPVRPVLAAEPREGYRLDGPVRVEPSRILVKGPWQEVSRLGSLPTEPIVLPGVAGNFTLTAKLDSIRAIWQTDPEQVTVGGRLEPIEESSQ